MEKMFYECVILIQAFLFWHLSYYGLRKRDQADKGKVFKDHNPKVEEISQAITQKSTSNHSTVQVLEELMQTMNSIVTKNAEDRSSFLEKVDVKLQEIRRIRNNIKALHRSRSQRYEPRIAGMH